MNSKPSTLLDFDDFYTPAKDPILQELWQIKADLNREANYDLAQLAKNARECTERLMPNMLVYIPPTSAAAK
jgi:hypothetical protein